MCSMYRMRGKLPDLWRAAAVTQYQTDATQDLAAQVRAGSRPAPDVVIWPENSTDLDPGLNPAIYATIESAVGAIDRPVLVPLARHPVPRPCCRTSRR